LRRGVYVNKQDCHWETVLVRPLVEFYYKNDALGDPLLTRDRLLLLKLATENQIDQLKKLALECDRYLSEFFSNCNLTLVDFKLEFGIDGKANYF
jgi:phosphoribosylaminoimidazole-succinocarboxamide synthase